MKVKKVHKKSGSHKESKSTGGTKNYQKQQEGKKTTSEIRICDNRTKKT